MAVHNAFQWKSTLKNVLLMAGILLLAAGLCVVLAELKFVEHGDAYVSMVFILAVFLVARVTEGYVYGIIASLASVLAVNFFFTYPFFAFNFSLPGYPFAIICMLTVSIATSMLVSQIKRQEQVHLEAEREKMRSNLLRAVSHDLRTPLTSILGATSAIIENDAVLTSRQRIQLLTEVGDDVQWLIRMVENLLAITRINQDMPTKITKTLEAAEEVVAETVTKFHKRFPNREVTVRAPQELLLCPMDAVLIEQVLLNLLENATLHGKNATEVLLTVERERDGARFSVLDNGVGIKKEQLAHIFDGVSTEDDASCEQKRNMGIGLSVCMSIIKAHNGEMTANNRVGGGAVFSFTLPLTEEKNGEPVSNSDR